MMMIRTLSSSCSLHFALLCIQIGSHIMHARIAKGSHLAPCNLPCLCIQVRELQQHVGGCGIAVVKLQVSSMNAVTKQSFCAKLVRSAA